MDDVPDFKDDQKDWPKDHWILSDEEVKARWQIEQARAKEEFINGYLENPSSRKLSNLLRSCRDNGREGLRGLFVNNSFYWWDAFLGTHTDGTQWLFPEITEFGHKRNEREIELHIDRVDNTIYLCADKSILDTIMQHPKMQGKWLNGCLIEK